ncbi:MAG: ribonuclease HI [Phycisphaerae bacterium]|nr:ribonuclease HI [Phycisphaerae bacterium]
MKEVTIHTDGSSRGNPGPGGYGVVLRHGATRKELAGGFRRTTNNRMELLACIVALRALREPCQAEIHSDSQYVVNGVTKGWAKSWRSRGWRKADKKRPENVDLWRELLDLLEKHEVRFHWLRGHAGHPENERCDQLATRAADQPDLPPDQGYETAGSAAELFGD